MQFGTLSRTGTDMTETVTIREGRARVFVAVDHCSGECVGNHAARSGNRFEALEPIRQGVLRPRDRSRSGVSRFQAVRRASTMAS
jgi:putative transposase